MKRDIETLILNDGAGATINVSADDNYITFSIMDFNGLSLACLSLEQVREMMGWMRQAMAEIKEAAR